MKMWFDSNEYKIIACAIKEYKETVNKLLRTGHSYAYDALQELIDVCDDILSKCDNADD